MARGMVWHRIPEDMWSEDAGEDLRMFQHHAVRLGTDNKFYRAGAGESFGILENFPNVNENANVQFQRICPAVSGAACEIMDYATTDAQGRIVPVVAAGARYQYRIMSRATAALQGITVLREVGVRP